MSLGIFNGVHSFIQEHQKQIGNDWHVHLEQSVEGLKLYLGTSYVIDMREVMINGPFACLKTMYERFLEAPIYKEIEGQHKIEIDELKKEIKRLKKYETFVQVFKEGSGE